MRLTVDGTTTDIPMPGEAILGPSAVRPSVEVTAQVVFAGFGVTAPEFGYDDYAGVDVKGKIVALLFNAPARLPSEPRASLRLSGSQAQECRRSRCGRVDHPTRARRCQTLSVGTAEDALRPADTDLAGRGRLTGAEREAPAGGGVPEPRGLCAPVRRGADDVQRRRGGRPQERAAREPRSKATLTMRSTTSHKRVSSPNVVGVLEGQRPVARGDVRRADGAPRSHGRAASRQRRSDQQRRLRQRDGQRHPARSGTCARRPARAAEAVGRRRAGHGGGERAARVRLLRCTTL